MATAIYKVTMKSDGGRTMEWTGAASSREAAIKAATKAENAPTRSVVSVARRNASGSTNEMKGAAGKSGEKRTFIVYRVHQDGRQRVLKRNLSETEAKAMVSKPGTSGGDYEKGTAFMDVFTDTARKDR